MIAATIQERPLMARARYIKCLIFVSVCTGGDKDRKLLTWDSAREFDKRLEIKLPDRVGSARSLTKQTIDQVSSLFPPIVGILPF